MSYETFLYQPVTADLSMPYVRVRLRYAKAAVDAWALADTGAEVNVLPHRVGVQLGLDWKDFPIGPKLGGNAGGETRVVAIDCTFGKFNAVPLRFCWMDNDNVRILLGHQDFFEKFVAFFDSRNKEFSIQKHAEPS